MSSISKLVSSRGWRIFMSRMYGWGAAMVIIGALFKLQHWKGSGYMLSIGMITECVIFFFSAFEPLPTEYHWEKIYPELAGDNQNLTDNEAASVVTSSHHHVQQGGGLELAIDPEDANNLKKNVTRFNESVNSLSALATISDASNQFVSGLQQAANNMGVLNESTQVFASAYHSTAQTINAGGQQANANLTALNKNLQAVNTSYELYLQEHKEYVDYSKKLLSTMDNSARQSQQFDQHMNELNRLIAELNTTYTSVVNTVNTTLKKR